MKHSLILSFFLIFLLSISFASAMELSFNAFDKKLDPTINLGRIEFRHTGFLGLTDNKLLATTTLDSNTPTCSNDCLALFTDSLTEDAPLIEDIRFYRIMDDGSYVLSNIRDYHIYIQSGKGWVEYPIGSIVPAGDYTYKIVGDKRADFSYDWQIQKYGEWTTEWAIWGSVNIKDNLVTYLTFDNTYNDSMGKMNGTNSGTTFTNGIVGQGVRFVPTQSISYPSLTQNKNYTMSLWINTTGTPAGVYPTAVGFDLTQLSTDFDTCPHCYYGISGGTHVSYNFNPNQWYYLTIASNDTGKTLYVNGAYSDFSATTNSLSSTTWYLGRDQLNEPQRYFTGMMDEFAIFNRSLSLSEIQALYNNGQGTTFLNIGQGLITLKTPTNNQVINTAVNYNCSAVLTGGAKIRNISLYDNSTGTFKINETKILGCWVGYGCL